MVANKMEYSRCGKLRLSLVGALVFTLALGVSAGAEAPRSPAVSSGEKPSASPPKASPSPSAPSPNPPTASPTPPAPSPTPGGRVSEKDSLIVTPDYIIGPEDVLDVIVWKNPELSKVVTVRPDGRISLPLVGDVDVTGLTPTQLTNSIVEKLKQYKETPTVSVILQQVNSYGVYILGDVAKPGRFFLKSKTTLLQAITNAGGFTQTAARNKIAIFRWVETPNGESKEVKLKASYDEIVLRDNSTQNLVLKPGDTIVVPSESMVLTQ